ncbi:cysteine-rich and transmembrane domain-containing protein WIH2-like [Cucurbita pepo subsp. pepo]|uniref:cysteine-rich and transmembrane domain-containing protein WIH2-like n=1 Tax=Cucurbita pepo subsp. pepo TaxID=3664 RepID=UPI000C9D9784|nr:cysteine-rich and transmembrane domain-containing protein WIH2-like [Cucurbita pepo subsp. pepo]
MSQYPHQQIPMAYPAPPPSYPAVEEVKESNSGPYVAAPPPVGYPVREGPQYPHQTCTPQTQSKGDGFWKGCVAALCCCWVLDCVF